MDIVNIIERDVKEGRIEQRYAQQILDFYRTYYEWRTSRNLSTDHLPELFATFWRLVLKQCDEPYQFEAFHPALRQPFDYHKFGTDIMRGIVDEKASVTCHLEWADRIVQQLEAGENVILISNHQTEADPQILSILLEKSHPRLAHETIFIAGARVTTDPLAVPYSLGCNLISVYSKRHIDHPPEQRSEKLAHNMRAMKVLYQLLTEGGKVVWVAPSGGRDRRNAAGQIEVAQFDPLAVEMFRLMAKRSSTAVHFYPLALYSHGILPPPESIDKELGEARYTEGGPVNLGFGPELNFEHFPGSESSDKQQRRVALADYCWQQVADLYHQFPEVQKERE